MRMMSRQGCQATYTDLTSRALVPSAAWYGDTLTPINALHRQAETRPDGTALIASGEVWTYQRMATEAERLAYALLTRGVQQGDRVALHMANLPELAVAYYACFRIGAIAVPLNIRLKAAELRPLLQRLQPALYLGQAELYPQIASIEPEILASDARFIVGGTAEDGRAQLWASLLGDDVEMPILRTPGLDTPAVLLSTSGTTGQSKFVVHTPATLSAIADAFVHLGLDGEQIALNTVPMVHISGIATFLAYVRFGVPMVLLERFDPDAVLDAIEAHRCSWMVGLPFMFAELLTCQHAQARDIGSLRHCLTGGDVCPPELQQEFSDVFGIPLRSFWAATEVVGALTYGLQPGPVSRIAPGAQVRLVDDAGAPVPRGEVGELLVHGPSVSVGYWAGPDRGGVRGWLVPYRRPHATGPRGRPLVCLPQEGADRPRRLEHLPDRGGAGPDGASRRARRRRGRRAGPSPWPTRGRPGPVGGWRRGRRRPGQHPRQRLGAARRLQGSGTAAGRRRDPQERPRQDRS